MQKTGSLELFPNSTTASNVNEGTRILLRERMQYGSQLSFAAVWDAVRTGYLMSCGTGVENIDAALQLLNGNSQPARVLMAQVRQPFSNRNGQEPKGRKHVDDMNIAELRQGGARAGTLSSRCKRVLSRTRGSARTTGKEGAEWTNR